MMLTAAECVDVSSVGSGCYLKGSVNAPQYNGAVLGGVQVGTYNSATTQITATPTGAGQPALTTQAPTTAAPPASTGGGSPAPTVTVTTTISGAPYGCQCTALASSSAPAPSSATCPGADSSTFTGTCGSQYAIECGIDRSNHDSKLISYPRSSTSLTGWFSSWQCLRCDTQRLHQPV
jgi:hypothetical protein